MIKQNIRTAPYYNVPNADWEYALMRELRKELLPKIKRRIPWHHLSGFSHRYIIDYVTKAQETISLLLSDRYCRVLPVHSS